MEMNNAEIKFLEITPEIIQQFLDMAFQRILIAKAGYFEDEIKQLVSLVKALCVRIVCFCSHYLGLCKIKTIQGYDKKLLL